MRLEMQTELFNKYGNLDKLGEGSARIVYKLTDKLVVKIAKNKEGLYQNATELKHKGNKNFATILQGDTLLYDNNDAVIMEYLKPLDDVVYEYLSDIIFEAGFETDPDCLQLDEMEFLIDSIYDKHKTEMNDTNVYSLTANALDAMVKTYGKFDYDYFEEELKFPLVDYFSDSIMSNDISMGEIFSENVGVTYDKNGNTILKIIDGGVDSEEYFDMIQQPMF